MDHETSPAGKTAPRRHRLQIVRQVGAIVLAIAAVVVMVAMAPRDSVTIGDIAYVMAGDSLNQKSAAGAPQQAVVNAWTARDLLELAAKQGVEARDYRPAALLTLLVLGMCLTLATSAPGARRHGVDDSGVGLQPASEPATDFGSHGAKET